MNETHLLGEVVFEGRDGRHQCQQEEAARHRLGRAGRVRCFAMLWHARHAPVCRTCGTWRLRHLRWPRVKIRFRYTMSVGSRAGLAHNTHNIHAMRMSGGGERVRRGCVRGCV